MQVFSRIHISFPICIFKMSCFNSTSGTYSSSYLFQKSFTFKVRTQHLSTTLTHNFIFIANLLPCSLYGINIRYAKFIRRCITKYDQCFYASTYQYIILKSTKYVSFYVNTVLKCSHYISSSMPYWKVAYGAICWI